ncbi:Abnormal spindle-like microcephaly-associated protein-like [Durusdinium trenchii]|uniref:Abnormal spindle-like microcephaly-associated protein-like n=1 Tax=Durusdinium trenchii TaxID=1381693 RepID=A0ABP0QJZ5_9DINO
MRAKTPKAFLNFVVGCLVREAARTWLDDWSMIALLRGSPFAFLKDANDVLGAEVADDAMLARYKEGDSSVTRSKRVRSGTAALVSLQDAVSAALEACGNTHWATDVDFVALATELNLGFIIALGIMRKDDAAWKILRNYKAWKWNKRADKLLQSVLKIQRAWHSSVHRKWIKRCHQAAACIQRHARGFAVRLMLDRPGRQLTAECQTLMEDLVARRSHMSETRWWALTAVHGAKVRVRMARHRQRNLDRILMQGLGPRSNTARQMDKQRRLRMKGALQPARETVFEPFIFALARLDIQEPRYGAKRSPVMEQVIKARKELVRWLPDPPPPLPHIAARRGRNAVLTRRLVKKARHSKAQTLEPEDGRSRRIDEQGQ